VGSSVHCSLTLLVLTVNTKYRCIGCISSSA